MYLTQLYPERTGMIVFDSVVSPVDLGVNQPYLESDLTIADAEAVWKGFLEACAAAGTPNCPVARSGDTADSINTRVDIALEKTHNIWSNTTDYSYVDVVDNIYSFLYWPETWGRLGEFLYNLTIFEYLSDPPNDPDWYLRLAIQCGDSADPIGQTMDDVFKEMVRVAGTVSRKFGPSLDQYTACIAWETRAVERYTGPFNKKPRSPVLILGNQADPVTPFRNAKILASSRYFGNSSRLIQRWDFGHSMSSESTLFVFLLIIYSDHTTRFHLH